MRARWRVVLSCGVVVFAVGIAACGDAEDGQSRTALGQLPNPERFIPDPPLRATGELVDVQEVIDDYQDGLLMLSGGAVCHEITRAAQRAVTSDGDCSKAYDTILRDGSNPTTRRVRSKVVAVDVAASARVADVTLTGPGRKRFHLRLRYEGEWKIPRVDLDDPTGFPAG